MQICANCPETGDPEKKLITLSLSVSRESDQDSVDGENGLNFETFVRVRASSQVNQCFA
jgi:hypothetical protein